ncbi:MAG TPA: efflux RND transporter periplasmic adaptor subunit [Steroidobacteraceae bacterium]|nr:efflux RND transporter periplasmic adaptor subunit [Steroidobacteraceae bacterium]
MNSQPYILIRTLLSTLLWTAIPHAVLAASSFECLIEPNQTADIRSSVVGTISQITVHRGEVIHKGQPLVALESDYEQAAFELARYKAQMNGQVREAAAKFEFAKRAYERKRDMHEKKLMSAQDMEDAEKDMKADEAELQMAQENHQVAVLESAEQEANLNRRTIRSPFDGVVVDQLLFPGEIADLSDPKKPILKIAQIDPLLIRIIFPRALFGEIRKGTPVTIAPEAPVGGQFRSYIKIVAPIVDAASGTFIAFAQAPNPQLKIPAGIRCQASLTGSP